MQPFATQAHPKGKGGGPVQTQVGVERVQHRVDADSRADLLSSYIQGKQTSFYQLAYSYVKDSAAAMDVVQEASYKALRSVGGLRNLDYMKTWFYRILVNESLQYLRKNRKSLPLEDAEWVASPTRGDLHERLDLYDAIDRLPPKYKTVVILRYFEDFTMDEIAKVMGCPVGTIKSRASRAMKFLRQTLDGEEAQDAET
jgi:RNA polymerase sigma-70 factor (ECF subfamily)